MRCGILGGSFDPPHLGHLIIADQSARALELERVLFVPAYRPPHKSPDALTPFELRAEMVAAAIAGEASFALSTLEGERGGVSYTIDTLRELARRSPADELWLLLGQDSIEDLVHWREPEALAQIARLAVYRREGATGEVPESLADRTRYVDGPRVDVSSTELRERLRSGRSVRYLVPESVLAIIRREGLYGTRSGAR